MESDSIQRIEQLEQKIEEIRKSVNWTKRYLQLVISILIIVLPILATALLVPIAMNFIQNVSPLQMLPGGSF